MAEQERPAGTWAQRWRAARVIGERQRSGLNSSIGIYVTMSLALAAASLTLHNTVQFVERNAVLSARQPLFLPVTLIVVAFSFILGIGAALSTARERDRGTLRVLLFGPADEVAFLFGHFQAHVATYAMMAAFGVVWANLVTYLLNLDFSWHVIAAFALSILTVAAVIAFGLLAGVWGGTTRSTLVYLILITVALIGLQIGVDVIPGLSREMSPTQNDPIFVVRDVLVALNAVAQWVSPYAQLSQALEAMLDGNAGRIALHIGVTITQTLIFFSAATLVLKRKEGR